MENRDCLGDLGAELSSSKLLLGETRSCMLPILTEGKNILDGAKGSLYSWSSSADPRINEVFGSYTLNRASFAVSTYFWILKTFGSESFLVSMVELLNRPTLATSKLFREKLWVSIFLFLPLSSFVTCGKVKFLSSEEYCMTLLFFLSRTQMNTSCSYCLANSRTFLMTDLRL